MSSCGTVAAADAHAADGDYEGVQVRSPLGYPAWMATIPCPSCGHAVDIKVKRCPTCGGPMSLVRLLVKRQPALALAIAVAGMGFLVYCYWSFTHP